MKIIGVTGGIGSGKSTVSHILSGLGVKIIDSDMIAREIVQKGEKALNELVGYFGNEILDKNCELDRRKLGQLVFNNSDNLKALNDITHKYIIKKIMGNIDSIRKENVVDIVALDAPIPVEHGFLDVVDEVWVVVADQNIRIKRMIDRTGLTYDEVVKRIHSQKKDEEYIALADKVIYNNGSREQLENDVKKLLAGMV